MPTYETQKIDVTYQRLARSLQYLGEEMASTYIYAESLTDFEAQLESTWDLEKGYRLVDVEYIDGEWTGVFVDNGGANAFDNDEEFAGLQEQISDRFDEGYDLVDIDYVDDT